MAVRGLLLGRVLLRLGLLLGVLLRAYMAAGAPAAAAERFSRGPSVALPRCTAEPGPISI